MSCRGIKWAPLFCLSIPVCVNVCVWAITRVFFVLLLLLLENQACFVLDGLDKDVRLMQWRIGGALVGSCHRREKKSVVMETQQKQRNKSIDRSID